MIYNPWTYDSAFFKKNEKTFQQLFDELNKSADELFKKDGYAFELLKDLISVIRESGQEELFEKVNDPTKLKTFISKYTIPLEDKWCHYYLSLYPNLTKEVILQMIKDKTLPVPDLRNYNEY